MARILCTQKLLKALEITGRPARSAAQRPFPGLRLGDWAATRSRVDGHDLVIALEQRTCLTLAFPFTPRADLRTGFADALTMALADLGVPEALAIRERAGIEAAPIERLSDRTFVTSLNDVEYMCGIELLYLEDLRRVQRNLNEFPHARCNPHVPMEGVARLFSAAGPHGSRSVH